MIFSKGKLGFFVLVAAFAGGQVFGAKAPDWLSPLISYVGDSAARESGAVVLLDEAEFDYNERGSLNSTVRWAVKIFDKKERDRAVARISFEEGYGQVTSFRAWLIDPNGTVYKYEKKDTWDTASSLSDLHSTLMTKNIDLSDSVRDGTVFGFEYKIKKKTVFSQLPWFLNQDVPVLKSVVSVVPPDGWDVFAEYLNGAEAHASRNGKAYVWTATDLKARKTESNGPPSGAVAPFLGIGLRATEKADRSVLQSFEGWADIAAHDGAVNDGQIEPDEAIRAKALELCDDVSGEWEQLSAIGAFTQSVNYVSISADVSLGGGYKPFTAAEVLARHYGDCKDKTALTRSLLKCIGKESYAVSADIGSGAYVDPKWPSLHQFNHCIVAISVSDEIDTPAVVEDAKLGRLLLFDPTSQMTPIGSLPADIHGSYVLLGSDQVDGLLQVPVLDPDLNKVTRKLSVKLFPSGDIEGKLTERSTGEKAQRERAYFRNKNDSDYKALIRGWLSSGGISAKIDTYQFEDDFAGNSTKLEAAFYLATFARSMREKFLVFKPFVLNQTEMPEVGLEERTQPFRILPRSEEEIVEVEIPDGFAVDDFMKPVLIETDFGVYESKVEEINGVVVCTRTIRQKAQYVEVGRYAEVIEYYNKIARSEQKSVVLIKL